VGSSASVPGVLNCAVNELVDTPRGVSPLGRSFIGPLSGTNNPQVPTATRNMCAAIMQQVAAQYVQRGWTPSVISRFLNNVARPAPIGLPVVGFRTDDRWDVLKSRRLPPTTTTSYPLTPTV
jgi:hypothetical protein